MKCANCPANPPGKQTMREKLAISVLACAFTGPVGGQDQPTYDIKVKSPRQGDTVRVSSSEQMESGSTLVDNQGKVRKEENEKDSTNLTYEETILERADHELKRLKREYATATRTIDGKRDALPYDGKTVLIEKENDRYHFQIDRGQEIAPQDAPELDQEFTGGNAAKQFTEMLLPKKAVQVGEVWNVSTDILLKELKSFCVAKVDAAKGVATGKLVKVYHKDGRQFGVLELTIDLPITAGTYDGKTQIPAINSRYVAHWTLPGTAAKTADRLTMSFDHTIAVTRQEVLKK
jgi:hypothetical protein